MKTWFSEISFHKESRQYLASSSKMYKEIGGTWCYHKCQGPILLIRDEKTQMHFSISKSL